METQQSFILSPDEMKLPSGWESSLLYYPKSRFPNPDLPIPSNIYPPKLGSSYTLPKERRCTTIPKELQESSFNIIKPELDYIDFKMKQMNVPTLSRNQFMVLGGGVVFLQFALTSQIDKILNATMIAILTLTALAKLAIHHTTLTDQKVQRLHALAMENIFYNEMWKNTQEEGPIRFVILTSKQMNLSSWNNMGSTAQWNSTDRIINLYDRNSKSETLDALIFETANAYHDCFIKIIHERRTREICEANEWTRDKEWIEFKSQLISNFNLAYGTQELGWPFESNEHYSNFADFWELENIRSKPGVFDSHTDKCRRTVKKGMSKNLRLLNIL